MLRIDLKYLYEWIAPGSGVLDLGCGGGDLLQALTAHKNCQGYGVEIDGTGMLQAMAKGINVIQYDIDSGLAIFADDQFDVVVLSQTIQAMRNTEQILREMLRVAKTALVTFPNFGYWRNRLQLSLRGRMPISESMPYVWYDTPNIHWCTLTDFERLCAANAFTVTERLVLTHGKKITFRPNLRGSLAVYRIGR